MLLPQKHERAYHQGALLNMESYQEAHLNQKSNENEEGPMGHSTQIHLIEQ